MSSIFFGQQDWLGGCLPKRPECSYKCVKGRIKTGRGQCDACVLSLLPEPPQTKRSKNKSLHCTEKNASTFITLDLHKTKQPFWHLGETSSLKLRPLKSWDTTGNQSNGQTDWSVLVLLIKENLNVCMELHHLMMLIHHKRYDAYI